MELGALLEWDILWGAFQIGGGPVFDKTCPEARNLHQWAPNLWLAKGVTQR